MNKSLSIFFCILSTLSLFISPITAKGIRATGPPCPDDVIIDPCTCSYDTETLEIDLSCRWVKDEDQLRGILNQELPVYDYASLDIWQESMGYEYNITQLTSGVFGDCTFGYINFEYTDVRTVDPDVFDKMKGRIRRISFQRGILEEFSFNFVDYTALEIININYNSNLEHIRLSAPTVELFSAYGGSLRDDTVALSLPSVTSIDLGDNFFVNVPDLSSSIVVDNINLNGNLLSSIEEGDLCHSPELSRVDFSYNEILKVNVNSLCVRSETELSSTYVYFGVNKLTTLDEDAWKEVTRNSTNLSLNNNPLQCGCDIKWLYTEENLIEHVMSSSTCNDGTNLHELDGSNLAHCNA